MIRRRLFRFVAAFSFSLFLATVALWVRSFWRADEVTRLTAGRGQYVSVTRGEVSYYDARVWLYPRALPKWSYDVYRDTAGRKRAMDQIEQRVAWPSSAGFRVLGLAFRRRGVAGVEATVVIVPLWAPAVLFATPPALWMRSRRRARDGLCPACGYDLRASTGRCPECGTPIAAGQLALP